MPEEKDRDWYLHAPEVARVDVCDGQDLRVMCCG